MKNTFKNTNVTIIAVMAVALIAAPCAFAQAGNTKPARVSIWTFTKETADMLDMYKGMAAIDETKVQFEVIKIDIKDYQSKLDAALKSKKGAPDVFALEAAFLGKYVESGKLADLSSLASGYAEAFPYTVEMGTDRGGAIRALSWHAVPGGFFYRRSMAKKYFGSDDPAAVQERLANPEAFLEAARELKRASNGKVAMVCSTDELFNPFKGARDSGWLDGNKLVIDPMMVELARLTKIFRDEGLDPRLPMWSAGWFQGMRGTAYGLKDKGVEIFGYFLPTWGLHYVLKPNVKDRLGSDTTGDWGLARGPVPYSWGGTWLAASGGEGEDAAEALKFIEFCCTNEVFLKPWARKSGDVVSNAKVASEISGEYSDSLLAGQNHYAAFVEIAGSVKGKNVSPSDTDLDAVWQDLMKKFLLSNQSENTFIQEFKLELSRKYDRRRFSIPY